MPWHEVLAVEQRFDFVREYQLGLDSMAELARRYGITPKTGYLWVGRYDAGGGQVSALAEHSRRPHGNARAIPPWVVARVLAARHKHPRWGAGKLLAWLAERDGTTPWPKRATVCDLLRRAGLVTERRRRPRRAAEGAALTAPVAPNELWTVDFKGQFRVGDGTVCYPLTLRDAASRYLLRCDSCGAPETQVTRARCARAFREYGLPERMGSDNGSPFGSTGLRRLSRLAVWWMRLGIRIARIRPGHPEDNGSHEQFHHVLKAQTARPPATSLRGQQQRFAGFRREYNEERPHEAHGQQPPARFYVASPRPFPRRLPVMEYAGHLEVRRVFSNGCVKWHRQVVYLTEVLAGEDVGWEETDDGLWSLYFGPLLLGRFDERRQRFLPAGGT
jgi:putative transposase